MSKKGRSRKRRRRGGGTEQGAQTQPSVDHADDEPATTSPTASPSTKPIAHSTEARAAKMKAERQRSRWKTRLRRTAIGIGVGVPIVAVLAFTGGVFEPQLGVEASNEGGVGRHVAQGRTLSQQNRPPSSGLHYPSSARYAVVSDAILAGNWIHNLEHGGIVILYRCEDPEECGEIASRVRTEISGVAKQGAFGQVKIVGTPYQDMDTPFIALAWRRTLPLQELDAEQILAFYDRYVDRGPERAP